jgi:hypothetical protein
LKVKLLLLLLELPQDVEHVKKLLRHLSFSGAQQKYGRKKCHRDACEFKPCRHWLDLRIFPAVAFLFR